MLKNKDDNKNSNKGIKIILDEEIDIIKLIPEQITKQGFC